ncbi:GtrA family protein [Basilea psittacipulmonis]|uniref:GtrA/DPMS transmembrane domain-containing protein n=1 Tax=Basilea psittacipulmonis DSM 24701 TaxID=1072685 RepID=A0A077DD29_9BURK|nr:GtrA family protein [Basilea psittacipulmonis]AIL32081.1 hypothetical protein IX83_00960 [Basilea psittacipulmonis DSM 24701]
MSHFFKRYFCIGILNTLIHWSVAGAIYYCMNGSQAMSNLLGFAVATTFSFFANASWNFKMSPTFKRYILFTLFMGCLAYSQGAVNHYFGLPLIVSLFVFSLSSLVLGFLYARFIVFKS